ncbi:MAG TPA: GGDEF domain-containing protein [Bryobacteraceae bacterium]|nr:GGDEF domain-containing protein [Bryobacteraceae bacterium]
MISLRKHIEAYDRQLADALRSACRAVLLSAAKSGGQAVPSLAAEFSRSLNALREKLGTLTTPSEVESIQTDIETEFAAWGENAAKSSLENLNQIKEVMMTVASSAAAIADRDHRYTDRFKDLASRLQTAARVNDLEKMRRSVVDSASEIKTCVAQMAEESEHSLEQLKSQVSRYRAELREFQKRDATDSLTGLASRQEIDAQIEDRMVWSSTFCLAILDLNEFKGINDRYGHATGDDVLKQFAKELRFLLRSSDVVGRWGGDEFVLIIDSTLVEAGNLLRRVREWAFGEYQIAHGSGTILTIVTAAIGVAEWDGKESARDLFNRADQLMYVDKRSAPVSNFSRSARSRGSAPALEGVGAGPSR